MLPVIHLALLAYLILWILRALWYNRDDRRHNKRMQRQWDWHSVMVMYIFMVFIMLLQKALINHCMYRIRITDVWVIFKIWKCNSHPLWRCLFLKSAVVSSSIFLDSLCQFCLRYQTSVNRLLWPMGDLSEAKKLRTTRLAETCKYAISV